MFIIGPVGVGLALMLGIGARIVAASGAAIYLAPSLPPVHNPFLDEHLNFPMVERFPLRR